MDALELLAPHFEELKSRWTQELLELGISPDDLAADGPLDLARLPDLLRATRYPTLRESVERTGCRLAAREVPLPRVIAAINRLYELMLDRLDRLDAAKAAPTLALARLHSVISLFAVAGYTGQSAGKRTLAEESFSEAEQRLHDASAYVTQVYETERRRLSQDLHDDIGHDLVLIKLYLEMIALETGRGKTPAIAQRLEDALGLVSHTIDSVRRLVLDLGPAIFDELGFPAAVRTYANQFSSRTKIRVTVQEGYLPENIPMSHQVALYRLMQGALSNVVKHAHAKNVRVSLGSIKGSMLMMVIEDDGVGFNPSARSLRSSFGLTAMRERVAGLKGKIHIESKSSGQSETEHGTRIEVDLPLPGGERS